MQQINGIRYENVTKLYDKYQGKVSLIREVNTNKEYILRVYNQNTSQKNIEKSIKLLLSSSHPNIAQIVDFGNIAGNLYTITSHTTERVLDLCINEGKLALYNRILLLRDVLQGIKFLHDNGLVHSNIKTSNIFIDASNTFKGSVGHFSLGEHKHVNVMEDSIAKNMIDEISFLPPEYLKNEIMRFDNQCDLYGVGVSLYRCITGCYPYGESKYELIKNINDENYNPPFVRRYLPKVPRSLQNLCKMAVSQDKEARVKTADQFLIYLEEVLKEFDLDYSCPRPGDVKIKKNNTLGEKKISRVSSSQHNLPHMDTMRASCKRKALLGLGILSVSLLGYGLYTGLTVDQQRNNSKIKKYTQIVRESDIITEIEQRNESVQTVNSEEPVFKESWFKYPNFYNLTYEELSEHISGLVHRNVRSLPKDYINAMYEHAFVLGKKKYEHSQVTIFDIAIKLQSRYSEFEEKDMENYYYLSSTRYLFLDDPIYYPQYTLLCNLAPTNRENRLIKKISKEILIYGRAKNAYLFIDNILNLFEDSSQQNYQNILEEMKGDVYRVAAQKSSYEIDDNHKEIFSKYFKKLIDEHNTYINEEGFNKLQNNRLEIFRPLLIEYIQLLRPSISDNQSFLERIEKLNSSSSEVIVKLTNQNNFDAIELHKKAYQEAVNKYGKDEEKIQLYAELNLRLFKLEIVKKLCRKSQNHFYKMTKKNFQRFQEKHDDIFRMILCSSSILDLDSILDEMGKYYIYREENRINYKSINKFLLTYSKFCIEDEKINESFRKLIEKEIKKQLNINENKIDYENSLQMWFKIQKYTKNYSYITSFYEELQTIPHSHLSSEELYVTNLETVVDAYNKQGHYKKSVDFIQSNDLIEKILKTNSEYSLSMLNQCAYVYGRAKKEKYLKELSKIAYVTKEFFKLRYQKKVSEPDNEHYQRDSQQDSIFMLSILRTYISSSYHFGKIEKIKNDIIEYKELHTNVLEYEPLNKGKLYENLLELHLLYSKIFKKDHKNYPEYLIEQYEQLKKNEELKILCTENRSLKKKYNQMSMNYKFIKTLKEQ